MNVTLSWSEIALRLALTVAVGVLIGYNRSEHGKAAGMSTTVLVCLAASVAMLQVNLLLPMSGRPPNSFVMNDLMRLPLGVLTGVGFIGAGAILRRGNLVVGVTTAATLWLLTIIGLCLGGGQIALGLVATALGLLALWALKALENRLRLEHRARLMLEFDTAALSEEEIRERLTGQGFTVSVVRTRLCRDVGLRRLTLDVCYFRRAMPTQTPNVINELAATRGVSDLDWRVVS
jgi:putative Mg2+ transporter-C (MgtC) family protein